MIVNVEYRCPECEKVFNCPANLASHRRWHKPKDGTTTTGGKRRQIQNDLNHERLSDLAANERLREPQTEDEEEGDLGCEECGKRFRKMPALRKHLFTHDRLRELNGEKLRDLNHERLSDLAIHERLRELPPNTNNNNTSPNSKSYSIAELLSPRKRASPDLLATPGNLLSHLATAGHHFHHRPPPPLISIATALSTAKSM